MSETMADEESGWAEVLRLREENDWLIAAVCPLCITELQRQESHDAVDVLEVENQRLRRIEKAARFPKNALITDEGKFEGRWVAVPGEDFDALRTALESDYVPGRNRDEA